jgi:alkanesulfonate monooxygenase SsuD/methylene tetrahydromethanopterin reductase-like flavin-dependent oxidoreductase (luciferase family)
MGAPRRVQPKPLQKPHPPLWGATSSADGHREIGRHGIGLCSFTVGVPPEDLVGRIDMYRQGLEECEQPVGKFVNDRAATFTMVHCADTNEAAFADAEESFPWYIKTAVRHIGSLVDWMEGKDLGTYSYAADMHKHDTDGTLQGLDFDYLKDSGSAVVGDPERCVELAKRYEAAGCDLLLCLVNPYKIPHEKVMRSIELLGEQVIPAFS